MPQSLTSSFNKKRIPTATITKQSKGMKRVGILSQVVFGY